MILHESEMVSCATNGIIHIIKQFTDPSAELKGTQLKDAKTISMDLRGNDEINESNHTQIITVKLRNKSAHKIYKNSSCSETDLVIQLNTVNKVSNEFTTDASCATSQVY